MLLTKIILIVVMTVYAVVATTNIHKKLFDLINTSNVDEKIVVITNLITVILLHVAVVVLIWVAL